MTDTTQTTEQKLDAIRRCLEPDELKALNLYCEGMSAYDAYKEAGLGDDKQKALRLVRTPIAQKYINEMNRLTATRSIMTLEAIDRSLSDIATAEIADVVEIGAQAVDADGNIYTPVYIKDINGLTPAQRAAIKSIKSGKNGSIEVELHDKMKALDSLIKRRGGYTEKQDINVNSKAAVVTFAGDNGRGTK